MDSRLLLIRVVVLDALVAGGIVGAVIHNKYFVRTGHVDITPILIGFGLILFVWAGATARTLFPAERRARSGHSVAHS